MTGASISRASRFAKTLHLAAVAATLSLGCVAGGDSSSSSEDDPSSAELAAPVTATFQDGVSPSAAYAGETDTTLQESTPTTAHAADATLHADRDFPDGTHKSVEPLLRFDLSSIPVGSTVTAVSLVVNVTNSTSGVGYDLYPVSRAWSAAQATWSAAATGSAWSGAGARGATDRGATAFATLVPTTTGKSTSVFDAAGVAAVQGWVNTPTTNNGLVLDSVSDQDGLIFDSSKATTAANRPALVVTYSPPAPPAGSGTGLLGQYYSDAAFGTLFTSRVDTNVAFNWAANAPIAGMPADNFSVRWTGQIQPFYSETYTFTTSSDDGVRVTVNGVRIIDNWTNHAQTDNTGTIALVAGQKVAIDVDYFDATGNSFISLSWSSASQTKEIVPKSQLFPAAAPPTSPGLDETGARIPDTSYAIPAGAVYLATTGADTNAGTVSAPVKTLAKALALAGSGGTVVARGGTYRDGNVQTGAPFNLQAYPHEQVWFDGTDVVAASSFGVDGAGHWVLSWSTPSFCSGHYYDYPYAAQPSANSGPCSHYDMANNPSPKVYVEAGYEAAGDPQMVFVDGVYVHEVNSLAKATGKNFYYDQTNRKLYLGENPAGHTVEVAARASAIVSSGAGTKIRGVGFRRYATNEYNNLTGGAVYAGGASSLLENDVFAQMAGGALGVSASSRVLTSVFAKNGFNGITSNGHQHSSGAADGIDIEGNIFNGNNAEHFGPFCSASCAQAGVKLSHMDGFTVKNNVFENNHGHGFWCDLACSKGVIVENVTKNNFKSGITYEVSDTGIIASNLVVGNADMGIRLCSANTRVYNNTLVNNAGKASIWLYDDPRSYGVGGWTDVGPDTKNVEIANNLISGSALGIQVEGHDTTAANTVPSQFFALLDYDAFYRTAGAGQALFYWVPPTGAAKYTTLASFQAAQGKEGHATDASSGADPFFVDAATGNYVVRTSSVAYHTGRSLPADVAAALGMTTTTVVSKGAIHWPGN